MEGKLLVDPQQLKNTATSFGNRSKTIVSLTQNMMTLVRGLNSAYTGEAATAYINTFSKLEEDMTQINNKIQEHVTDLNDMATGYEKTHTALTQENAALKSDYI